MHNKVHFWVQIERQIETETYYFSILVLSIDTHFHNVRYKVA